ncbi:MAG TPA: 30S ribosome-binding factor RbfA [Anaerolineaceae bacterium]|nr:30S ribosome-binding factor RbfA [Anaerolineaceae bacterium]
MPSPTRLQKIGDRLRMELSEMLVKGEIRDPRLDGISITEVIVDRELAYADVYVSAFEGVTRSKEVLQGLNAASGFLRKNLAERVELRAFPRLRFHWDVTPERADRIERLIVQIHKEEENNAPKLKE